MADLIDNQKTLTSAFGSFTLERLPVLKKQPLRAWDAADELLLDAVAKQGLLAAKRADKKALKILLVNDQFGALSLSLSAYSPQNWSDSYQAHLAAQHNHQLNQQPDTTHYIPSTRSPEGTFDWVLIKIPKTLALLRYQLTLLRKHITSDTTLLSAGMVKHIHTSTLESFEHIIGKTQTSLARKKARLIFSTLKDITPPAPDYPKSFYDKSWNITLSHHANVFAKEKLDIGARLLLEQLHQLPPARHIVDLGCGNGVLGIIAKRLQPASHITFLDESYMAIDSAKHNYNTAIGNTNEADFLVSDVFSNVDSNSSTEIDIILCNPPFHQQHATNDYLAWDMFKQSHKNLRNGGELWVVGNRHLGYHIKLKRLFGKYQTIASNKKFVVLVAKR